MNGIKSIRGNYGRTFIELNDGSIIVGDSEFRAKSGKVDGVYVYTQSLKYKETEVQLTAEEIEELMKEVEIYNKDKRDFIEWV
ncbi:MAG: hypothetical protein IKJ73_06370 [Lachnospiraceae bacterium]|nr:hypothetical protein [Lachnospiraceae bacterium]